MAGKTPDEIFDEIMSKASAKTSAKSKPSGTPDEVYSQIMSRAPSMKADRYLEKFKVDTNKFLTSVNKDFGFDSEDEEERKRKSFNAAEFFEERKKQADELKSRLGDAAKNLEANVDYYTPEYYDSMVEYLSNFDTMVDDVLSNYKPSLESREGL